MDRAQISAIAHSWHPIGAPLSDDSVRLLLQRSGVRPGHRVLDLGCGQGAWLTQLLEQQPDVRAVGVDRSPVALDAARRTSEQVQWVQADAATWRGDPADVVLSVGVSHLFGGLTGTLTAMRDHLVPGGRVVLGDAIWDVPPGQRALDALDATEAEFPDLVGLLKTARDHGFATSYGHVSALAEWDEYEWCWTGTLTQWALEEPDERQAALLAADEHRTAWLTGYRGVLGFATLVLHDERG